MIEQFNIWELVFGEKQIEKLPKQTFFNIDSAVDVEYEEIMEEPEESPHGEIIEEAIIIDE